MVVGFFSIHRLLAFAKSIITLIMKRISCNNWVVLQQPSRRHQVNPIVTGIRTDYTVL